MLPTTRNIELIGVGRTTLEGNLRDAAGRYGLRVDPEPNPEAGWYFRSDHFFLCSARGTSDRLSCKAGSCPRRSPSGECNHLSIQHRMLSSALRRVRPPLDLCCSGARSHGRMGARAATRVVGHATGVDIGATLRLGENARSPLSLSSCGMKSAIGALNPLLSNLAAECPEMAAKLPLRTQHHLALKTALGILT